MTEMKCDIATLLHTLYCAQSTDESDGDVETWFRREGELTATPKKWSSVLQVLALSTVVQMDISMLYPSVPYARPALHGTVTPLREQSRQYNVSEDDTTVAHPMIIMWARDSNFDNTPGSMYTPNHVVPVVMNTTCKGNTTSPDVPDKSHCKPTMPKSKKLQQPSILEGFKRKKLSHADTSSTHIMSAIPTSSSDKSVPVTAQSLSAGKPDVSMPGVNKPQGVTRTDTKQPDSGVTQGESVCPANHLNQQKPHVSGTSKGVLLSGAKQSSRSEHKPPYPDLGLLTEEDIRDPNIKRQLLVGAKWESVHDYQFPTR